MFYRRHATIATQRWQAGAALVVAAADSAGPGVFVVAVVGPTAEVVAEKVPIVVGVAGRGGLDYAAG